ncbi:MAG: YmdB family metallophosphoesterase [Spirochaetaceae bacterium]|nr:MAG: YmdB family metallophosphoesterase [Spirochaetaceae bacterium]
MRILYVAEIVGKPGLHCVKTMLAALRKERAIDFVIANGDSVTGGFGLGKNHSIQLRKLGVDVITGGEQLFFKKDMTEHIDGAHYLLRPANLPPEMPGRGWRHYTVRPAEWADLPAVTLEDQSEPDGSEESPDNTTPGLQVAVISLIGQSGFDRIHGGNPFLFLSGVVDRLRRNAGIIILDFHATTTAEKYTMFHHADGMVTAVIGSGQRVQTADAHVMPSGTAVICDAGRTGSRGGVGGYAPEQEIRKYLTRVPVKSQECWADLQFQGVLLDVDPGTGYVTGFEAIQIPCVAPGKAGSDS